MKLACSLLVLCVGCPSTHQLLTTTDSSVDAPPFDGGLGDAGMDAADCGPPPPDERACLRFIDDRDGVYCCDETPTDIECRDGTWQCPIGYFEETECNISASTCPWFDCSAMDAYSTPVGLDCAGMNVTRYAWDGRACRPVGFGCSFTACVGEDCESLYDTLEQCLSVRADCGAGQCEAMDARFPSRSEEIVCDGGEGATYWTWNGWACEMHLDCASGPDNCVGADCDSAYRSREACQTARRSCISSCDATDARVTCEGIGGTRQYVWNGHDCALVARCPDEVRCEGDECDEVYTSQAECRAVYRQCVGPATVDDQGALTCNLSQDDFVEAAVRLSACGITTANDVIAGRFELHSALPTQSVNPGWVGDCNLIRCASESADCESLEACRSARDDECVDEFRACAGNEVCRRDVRDGSAFWVPWADCTTLGGTCVDSEGDATCDLPGNATEGRREAWCDRDTLVVSVGGVGVRLACSEYLPGTVCRDIRFAGEFPGVACGYPDPECSEFLESAVRCDGSDAMLCVGGRSQRFDCVEAGYSGCEFGAGCVF